MSEMIKQFNKGDLLYIGEDEKAQWGQPEGYPYKEKISIDWDGNTDGLVATTGSTAMTLYKISDTLYDVGAITDFTYTMGNGEMSETDSETPGLLGSGNVWTSPSNMVWCCLTENYTMTSYGITFPESGLYVAGTPNFWIKNVSFTIAHPMAPEFLPSATSTTSGIVKQMPYLPNATGDTPTAENFNQLLRQLKNAGLMK